MDELQALKNKLSELMSRPIRDLQLTIAIHNLQQMINEREKKLKQ